MQMANGVIEIQEQPEIEIIANICVHRDQLQTRTYVCLGRWVFVIISDIGMTETFSAYSIITSTFDGFLLDFAWQPILIKLCQICIKPSRIVTSGFVYVGKHVHGKSFMISNGRKHRGI